MNIYQKICPECATVNSLDSISCGCGYSFDPDAVANRDPTEYAQQQDRLYRDYLAARIVQAEAELAVARERANTDPGNTYNASSALLAEQALHALRAEINQLSLKIPATTPARVKTAVSEPRKAAPTTPSIAPTARAEPPTAYKAPAVARVADAKPKSPRAAPSPTNGAKVALDFARKVVRVPTNGAKVALDLARKLVAASPTTATPRASSSPVAAASTASPVNGQHHPAKPNVGTRPDANFRRLQAEKAETIARSNRAATTPQPVQTVIKPASRTAPADVPPLWFGAQNPTQECPNCTATVAANSTRCGCGYTLAPPGEEVPAITLDATALAILTEGTSFNSSNRRR